MAGEKWRFNIKVFRKKMNLTQAQLAFEIGKTQQAIQNWEGKIGEPSINDLIKLTKILGISFEQLVEESNSSENPKKPTEYDRTIDDYKLLVDMLKEKVLFLETQLATKGVKNPSKTSAIN